MEQDSPDLRLIPPARGISATYNVMVEYSLKVKSNGSDASEKDDELIDGCFEVKQTPCRDIQLRNARLFSSLGPIDVQSYRCPLCHPEVCSGGDHRHRGQEGNSWV